MYSIYDAHSFEADQAAASGAFALSAEQALQLLHFIPIIPQHAKHFSLKSFLTGKKADQYAFLLPLVSGASAKAAFFEALPGMKTAAARVAADKQLSTPDATSIAGNLITTINKIAIAAGHGAPAGVQRA